MVGRPAVAREGEWKGSAPPVSFQEWVVATKRFMVEREPVQQGPAVVKRWSLPAIVLKLRGWVLRLVIRLERRS